MRRGAEAALRADDVKALAAKAAEVRCLQRHAAGAYATAALTHAVLDWQMASALEALDFPTDDDWRRLEQVRVCGVAACVSAFAR